MAAGFHFLKQASKRWKTEKEADRCAIITPAEDKNRWGNCFDASQWCTIKLPSGTRVEKKKEMLSPQEK